MEGTSQSPKTLRIVDGWTFQDVVTGLTLTVRCGSRLDVLSINGSKDFPGQRDFFFTKLGDFDGTGAAVGECPRHD